MVAMVDAQTLSQGAGEIAALKMLLYREYAIDAISLDFLCRADELLW